MSYPKVIGEIETLDLMLQGHSIARFGDGEFSLARGGNCVSQKADPNLAAELQRVLTEKNKSCLIGIPTMDPKGPKWDRWSKYIDIYPRFLGKKQYYSAFISRPDSAPWINNESFFDKMELLWKGKDVTLIANGERSLKAPFLMETGARSVHFVQCSYRDSYSQIDKLYADAVSAGRKTVILCAGPAATCLAFRLSQTKIGDERMHALDLGHIGMLWRPYLKGKHLP